MSSASAFPRKRRCGERHAWRFRGSGGRGFRVRSRLAMDLAGTIHRAQDEVGLVGREHDLELDHAAGQHRGGARERSRAAAGHCRRSGRCGSHGTDVRAARRSRTRPAPAARASVSGVATRVSARTLAYDSLPTFKAASMAGSLPSARATRTFSRAVAGSSPIRQASQCAHDTAPCSRPATLLVELANAFEQPVRGRIEVHRQFRYLLTQFLDGEHGENYTLVQCHEQRRSARFSTIFVVLR